MCDTISLSKNHFRKNCNFMVEVCDRLMGEEHPLKVFPGGTHQPGEKLQCTHYVVDQAEHTYTVLGCHQHWAWGAGMGINECGLAIGIDDKRFGETPRKALRELEDKIAAKTEEAEEKARALVKEGKQEEAYELLSQLSENSVAETMELMDKQYEDIRVAVNGLGGLYGLRTEIIQAYCKRVKLKLCDGVDLDEEEDNSFAEKMKLIQHH